MAKIFIDGSAGTTGLRIHERLCSRPDITLITLPDELRKDISARRDALNSADIAFLCLPDLAAIEAVSIVENPNTAIIDTSTAHRVADGWIYGFCELDNRREQIKMGKRIANPGCHASGFLALIRPLVANGIIDANEKLTAFSITGYTGGGKKMIAEYEENKPELYLAPRQYGLTQKHKHLPEMSKIAGLNNAPVFCPIVSDFACGMEVSVPLFASQVKGKIGDIIEVYKNYYTGKLVYYCDETEDGFMSANKMSGKDSMVVSAHGNDERIVLTARFDNLGKGASGSAIQNMNVMLGADETMGLNY